MQEPPIVTSPEANEPQRTSSVQLARRNLIISVTCVGAVITIEHFYSGLSLVVPAAVIFPYLEWTLRRERDAEAVNAAADQVYFLGYLCMIAALCALGMKVWRDPLALDNPDTVALALAMALLSTICGLVAMTTLRAHARTLQKPRNVADFAAAMDKLIIALSASELPDAVRQLISDLKEAPQSLKQLRETATDAQDAIGHMAGQLGNATAEVNSYVTGLCGGLRNVNLEIGKISMGVNGLNGLVNQGNSQVQRLSEAVRQVEQVLEAFGRLEELKLELENSRVAQRPL